MIAQKLFAPRHIAIMAALLGPLFSGCALPSFAGPQAGHQNGKLRVHAQAVDLNPEEPGQTRVGKLVFRAGLVLSSEAGDFGGLSGLSLSSDGLDLTAVSDHGDILRARLRRDGAGRVEGLGDAAMHRLRGVDGQPLSRRLDKRDQDAEAVERLDDGSYLVSFENRHRILRYANLQGRPSLFATPPGIAKAPRNGGLEAMAPLPDGRILVLSEKFRTRKDGSKGKGDYIGWLLAADGQSLGQVYWPGTGIFRPTDLAALPNGDVLLLQRRFTLVGGAGARLSRIPAERIKAGGQLVDEELAQLTPPMTVDNFEGLAVRRDPMGGWSVYLLSDDNFNPLQRTLLLQFHLDD
ncbi:MAG: esterase-like activity of phytase family protein [Alphaproteobacteria bacterium]|nr:esterase-like activity of phytase family protein [Alphaproteobacteria bacterium]